MADDPLLIRPHLQVAAICERHILEADGALTLFRIVDRFTISGVAEHMPPTLVQFNLIVKFAAGAARGSLNVSMRPIDPSHRTMQIVTVPTRFEGDDERSALLLGNMKLEVKEEGLHWIAIEVEGEEYTRIPLRVAYNRQPSVQIGG